MPMPKSLKQTLAENADLIVVGVIGVAAIVATVILATKQMDMEADRVRRVDAFYAEQNAAGRSVVKLYDGSLLAINPS